MPKTLQAETIFKPSLLMTCEHESYVINLATNVPVIIQNSYHNVDKGNITQ